jgi:hypothetical protein
MSIIECFGWVLFFQFVVFSFLKFTDIWDTLIERWHRKWVIDQATKFSRRLSDGRPYPILSEELAFWQEVALRLNQRLKSQSDNLDNHPS